MSEDESYKPTQAGVVLVFKQGISVEEAQERLEVLRDIVDLDYAYPKGMPQVEVFDPRWGGPVWYVP